MRRDADLPATNSIFAKLYKFWITAPVLLSLCRRLGFSRLDHFDPALLSGCQLVFGFELFENAKRFLEPRRRIFAGVAELPK